MDNKIHTTIGVYANLEYIVNGVLDKHLEEHINYNKTYRFGRALFVNGKCVYKGNLSNKEILSFEDELKENPIIKTVCTQPYQ